MSDLRSSLAVASSKAASGITIKESLFDGIEQIVTALKRELMIYESR